MTGKEVAKMTTIRTGIARFAPMLVIAAAALAAAGRWG